MRVEFDDKSKKLMCTLYHPSQAYDRLFSWYINGKKATKPKVDVAASLNISSRYTIDPTSDFINGILSATCNYTNKYTPTPGLKTIRLLNPGKNYLYISLCSIYNNNN